MECKLKRTNSTPSSIDTTVVFFIKAKYNKNREVNTQKLRWVKSLTKF